MQFVATEGEGTRFVQQQRRRTVKFPWRRAMKRYGGAFDCSRRSKAEFLRKDTELG